MVHAFLLSFGVVWGIVICVPLFSLKLGGNNALLI